MSDLLERLDEDIDAADSLIERLDALVDVSYLLSVEAELAR